MPQVVFTAHLLRHVACPDSEVDATTVGEALAAVFAQHPEARGYVLDEHGTLRKHVVVFIDSQRLRDRQGLSDAVAPHSRIHVLQALTGG